MVANSVVSDRKASDFSSIEEDWIPLCRYLELFITVWLNNRPQLLTQLVHGGISLRMCDQVQAGLDLSPVLPYQ